MLELLDAIGLPWRETRATLMRRYGVTRNAAYQQDNVEVPGRLAPNLMWPMCMSTFDGFAPNLPAGRFFSAAYVLGDVRANVEATAKHLATFLGPAEIEIKPNTLTCEWQSGPACIRLIGWPPEMQGPRLHNAAHGREPRLITACHVEVMTGFRLRPTPKEESWLQNFVPLGMLSGAWRLASGDVEKITPQESQVEFIREPGGHVGRILGQFGSTPDRDALIYCSSQLYLIPAMAIAGFRAERILPAKGGGGSSLTVTCLTGEPAVPRKTLTMTYGDTPDGLNALGAEIAAFFAKPFELGEPTFDV